MNLNPPSTIGPAVRTFKSSQANLVAGVSIGLFLLVVAGVLIACAPLQESKAISFQYVVGFACVLGGLVFLAYELFGEVKFNNEDSQDGLRTLEQFPWPEEIQGTMTFKQFFVIIRGKGELLPEPHSLELPSSGTGQTL